MIDTCEGLIWNNYQIIKQHFPLITSKKEILPKVDADIQSIDGLYIDILWDNVIFSITDKDNYAITYNGKFLFFEAPKDALDYFSQFKTF